MAKTLPSTDLLDHVHKAPGFLLWQIQMCWQRDINKVLSERNLTYTQFIVLSICGWLFKTEGVIYQHKVAKRSKIDRMMTSRILASLENKEYITREKMQDNARSKLVILTEKGKEALTIALRQVSEMEANFFKPSDRSFIDSMDDILSDCAIQAASSSIE